MFAYEAAERVLSIDFSHEIVLDAITSLCDNGLLIGYVEEGNQRFRMLVVRELASEMLRRCSAWESAGVLVSLTDDEGNVRYTTTNHMGYYRFMDLPTFRVYTVRVTSKKYTFLTSVRTVEFDEFTGESTSCPVTINT